MHERRAQLYSHTSTPTDFPTCAKGSSAYHRTLVAGGSPELRIAVQWCMAHEHGVTLQLGLQACLEMQWCAQVPVEL